MNVTVALNDENYSVVRSIAEERRMPIFSCESSSGKDSRRLITGVNVLWYGPGDRALVALPLNKHDATVNNTGGMLRMTDQTPSLRLDLKRDGMFVYRNIRNSNCIRHQFRAFFPAGKDQLADAEMDRLAREINDVTNKMLKPRKASIVGSTDIQPIAGNRSNDELALSRANATKAFLSQRMGVDSSNIETSSAGAVHSEAKCPDKPSRAMLAECLSSSRRVDIEIEFE